MNVLAIATDLEHLLIASFGTLYKLSKKHNIHILLTNKSKFKIGFAKILYIDKKQSLQEIISSVREMINSLKPVLVLVPEGRLKRSMLIASRNVENVLIYTLNDKRANILVDIEDVYNLKVSMIRDDNIAKKELFTSHKFMLDKWGLV